MRYRLTGTHPASREEIRNERDSGIPRAGNRAGHHLGSPMTHRHEDVMPI